MSIIQIQDKIFTRRKNRIRAKIHGTAERPRLSIFRSHRYIYAQIIDDERGHTLASVDSTKMKNKPVENAKSVGLEIAKKAKTIKINKVVFDRGGFLYAGKIKMVADAAREGGLEF